MLAEKGIKILSIEEIDPLMWVWGKRFTKKCECFQMSSDVQTLPPHGLWQPGCGRTTARWCTCTYMNWIIISDREKSNLLIISELQSLYTKQPYQSDSCNLHLLICAISQLYYMFFHCIKKNTSNFLCRIFLSLFCSNTQCKQLLKDFLWPIWVLSGSILLECVQGTIVCFVLCSEVQLFKVLLMRTLVTINISVSWLHD